MSNFTFALILTLFAGLSTGIGSAIAFFARKTNTKFLSTALGFSAGVMVYVSFVELFPQARDLVVEGNASLPELSVVIAFFAGIAFIFLIDMLIPSAENPHEMHLVEEMKTGDTHHLKRTGVLMALAIAIHNIPEGIAVSVPIYYATGNRKKAFWYSLSSGMAEPVGGLAGYFLLMPFITPFSLGLVMAAVAGIMVFISVDELIPAAERYGEHHFSIAGFVGGMAVMALSLLVI